MVDTVKFVDTRNFKITNEDNVFFNGEVMVTDPCYFLGDIWDELCGIWFENGNESVYSRVCTLYYKGAKILISRTAYGDGYYHVDGTTDGFGVDAGLMSVVSTDDLERAGLKRVGVAIAVYTKIKGNVKADGQGRFTGALNVDTKDENDEDDYCPHCGHELR